MQKTLFGPNKPEEKNKVEWDRPNRKKSPSAQPMENHVPMEPNKTPQRETPNAQGFFIHAKKIGDLALSYSNPLIVHHLDCDGLTSGAIAKKAYMDAGIAVQTLMLKKLDDTSAKQIPPDKDLVFTDLGAGQLELVEALSNEKKLIIDHHPPSQESGVPRINCHDFGFDGAIDACSASTAYFTFRHAGAPTQLGIVGAVGDMQDQNGFVGLNKVLIEEAIEKNEVLRTKDLRLFGKVSRSLVSFLTYCTEPILPGLTGNDKACAVFLKNEGIQTYQNGKTVAYYDLNVFERKKLASAIIQYAYAHGVQEKRIKDMIGDVYVFPKESQGSELSEAYEFSTLLNACGRHNAAESGIGACLKEEKALEQAKILLSEHRRSVRNGIQIAKKNTVDAGPFYLLDGRKKISDTIIGVVCGAYFSSGLMTPNKPIVGLSVDETGQCKASGRGSKNLCEKGLDLGEVMKKSAKEVNGFGGGHAVAAGASFDNTTENTSKFLKKAKQIVEVQLELR